METSDVVVVGAGHGGAQCAIALRQNGFTGTITIVGREAKYPYERSPHSKEYFAREKTFDRLYIRPPPFWAEMEISFRPRTEVTKVDPAAKELTLSTGPRWVTASWSGRPAAIPAGCRAAGPNWWASTPCAPARTATR